MSAKALLFQKTNDELLMPFINTLLKGNAAVIYKLYEGLNGLMGLMD